MIVVEAFKPYRSNTLIGFVKYSPVIEFTDKETRDRFSNAVLAALIEFAPDAFSQPEV